MTQAAQIINRNIKPENDHRTKSLKQETRSSTSGVNSGCPDSEPDEAFSKAFLACRGTIPADVELGFR